MGAELISTRRPVSDRLRRSVCIPLLLQSVKIPMDILGGPLYAIYIEGKPASGSLQRPFKAATNMCAFEQHLPGAAHSADAHSLRRFQEYMKNAEAMQRRAAKLEKAA